MKAETQISLSYIICTKNRLSYLKILEKHIFNHINADEEIVVVDGDSTDGSKKYLQDLFARGLIHQYISEPDHNQAHGWNKALLMAKGCFIKKIIDDDVHDLSAIRRCSSLMLEHPEIDLCISDVTLAKLSNNQDLNKYSRLNMFKNWKYGKVSCFTFSDVSMLIRKDALSYLGLYDTQFVMMDWEYALRCSYLQANIAYYTGCNSLAVDTPGNITSQATQTIFKKEAKIGKSKYNYQGDYAEVSHYSKFKIAIGKIIFRSSNDPDFKSIPPDDILNEIYQGFYGSLNIYNQENPGKFILKNQEDNKADSKTEVILNSFK